MNDFTESLCLATKQPKGHHSGKTGGESVAGNAEKAEPKSWLHPGAEFCAFLQNHWLIRWFEHNCRHSAGQRKLMIFRNIWNAAEITPSQNLAWPITATCQMHLRRHHKRFLPENHPRFCGFVSRFILAFFILSLRYN